MNALLGGPGRREVIVRSEGRVTYIPLSGFTQIGLVFLLGAVGAWVGHASYSYFDLQRVIADKDRTIAQSDTENRNLLAKMSEMREQFSDVAGTLEHNHRDLMNLLSQNHRLKQDLGDFEQKLQDSENKRAAGLRERETLDRRLAEIGRKVGEVEDHNANLQSRLDTARTQLADVAAARDRIHTARQTLDQRVKGLKQKLVRLRDSQTDLLNRVTRSAITDIRRAERVIARTGLNFDRLLKKAGGELGQGGPFIPLPTAKAETAGGAEATGDEFENGVAIYDRHIERLKQVRLVMGRLPLAAPLADYHMSSSFGRRRDPFNKKWSRHEGVDLAGAMRSPVIAPAPGKVLFAGWNGRFGRFVTIDHGMGIRTRYGHLRRITVKKGQKVKARQMIGQLGNSGRSTGAHLHYEVLVNGRPVNPMKFLKAGKDVLKG